jgi:chemotaxis protein methyltransferase CheR
MKSANRESAPLPAWAEHALELMARRFGHELGERHLGGLVEKLREVTQEFKLGSVEDCLSLLRTLPLDAPLVQRFLERATNKESYFFRDAATVASLREHILPALIARAESTRNLRIWSAGCSTGEEIYTINILLRELLPAYDAWMITLVGTDLDRTALARARRALYGNWSLRATTPEGRRSYFEAMASGHSLKARFRSNVSFVVHNLADAQQPLPAPGRFDLILCRNVTIYFSAEAQATVARTLGRALAPGGVWLAGPSDPAPQTGFARKVLAGALLLYPSDATERESQELVAPQRLELPPPESSWRALPPVAPTVVEPARERARPLASEELSEVRALADVGQVREALARLEAVLSEHTLAEGAYLLRAMVREASGDLDGACADLTRVLYLKPDHLEARLRLGLTLARLGEHERALAALRVAVSSPTDDAELAELRAVAAQQLVRMLRKAKQP